MADPSRGNELASTQNEAGVILVFWLLCLAALTGCMALAINIGNLAQQALNVQNAADASALFGAEELAKPQSLAALVDQYVAIPPYTCFVTANGSWVHCKSDAWLDWYYVYDAQYPPGADCPASTCAGWWQIVPSGEPIGPGQLSDSQAFDDAAYAAGQWQCAWWYETERHRPMQRPQTYYCGELYSDAATAQDSWDLSAPAGALGANPARTASESAQALAANYSLTPRWSACAGSPPSGFSFAEAWNGITCLAYKVTNDGHRVVFWAELNVGSISRTAWATSPPGRLCAGGPPAAPASTCQ